MNTAHNWSIAILFILNLFWMVSCDKNDHVDLIGPEYKTLNVSYGDDFEIPVLAGQWHIEFVQDVSSGEKMTDKNGNLLALNGKGKIEAANRWLTLVCEKEDTFTLRLKENFNKKNERKFTVCINSDGRRDYITVNQRAAKNYELIKLVFTEIEEERRIYKSNEGCKSLELSNNTPEDVWEPTGYVYEDVVESSRFESDDYGAFDWIPEEGINIYLPMLIIDDCIRWDNSRAYKEEVVTIPYIKDIPNGNKILMKPYTTRHLSGEITYCRRVCNYTLTIKNVESGIRFNINGTWTHVVPISSHTTGSN